MTRTSPPNRRASILVARGGCPVGTACGCCLGPEEIGHFIPGEDGKPGRQITNCQMPHPASERMCRPPMPSRIPPCPEFPTGGTNQAVCVECGRVTGSRWQGLPWCGGQTPLSEV